MFRGLRYNTVEYGFSIDEGLHPHMSTVADFIKHKEHNERQLALYIQWKYIEGQVKGSAYDFIAPDTSKIKAKYRRNM
jgi:hypothetical protein